MLTPLAGDKLLYKAKIPVIYFPPQKTTKPDRTLLTSLPRKRRSPIAHIVYFHSQKATKPNRTLFVFLLRRQRALFVYRHFHLADAAFLYAHDLKRVVLEVDFLVHTREVALDFE